MYCDPVQYLVQRICENYHTTFARIQKCLNLSNRLLIKLVMENEYQLAVEDEISKRHKKPNVDGEFKCTLQKISVELVKELSLYPLSKSDDYPGKRSRFPGVYLIYYDGETSLYGNQVHPSKDKPIYVGKSETSVYERLNQHHLRLNEAKDLQVQDFKVRFMRVDVSNFAPCIEGLLIEYYKPFWNSSKGSGVNLSFGNSQSNSNNWYKYHISQDKEAIQRVDGVKQAEPLVLAWVPLLLEHIDSLRWIVLYLPNVVIDLLYRGVVLKLSELLVSDTAI